MSHKNEIEERHIREKEQLAKRAKQKKIVTIGLVIGGIVLFCGFIFWLVQLSNQPVPGKQLKDLGREHDPVGTVEKYNSNPPTSGPHYAAWTTSGIYDKVAADEYLVHSLEHGYVILSYNCTGKVTEIPDLRKSGEKPTFTPLGDEWNTTNCIELKNQLKAIVEEKQTWKLIVIPRPQMKDKIALTAWNHLDTLDTLNTDQIVRFIDTFRDKGPEQTME